MFGVRLCVRLCALDRDGSSHVLCPSLSRPLRRRISFRFLSTMQFIKLIPINVRYDLVKNGLARMHWWRRRDGNRASTQYYPNDIFRLRWSERHEKSPSIATTLPVPVSIVNRRLLFCCSFQSLWSHFATFEYVRVNPSPAVAGACVTHGRQSTECHAFTLSMFGSVVRCAVRVSSDRKWIIYTGSCHSSINIAIYSTNSRTSSKVWKVSVVLSRSVAHRVPLHASSARHFFRTRSDCLLNSIL